MANILHICGWFDPAGDAYRCVQELNKYSRHKHELIVRMRHPYQAMMQLPEPESFSQSWPERAIAEADAIICHLIGWPLEWPEPPADKALAFRNENIRYSSETDRFWCEPQYNAIDLWRYSLISSSHVGAAQFLGQDRFRWLPDLIDIWAPELTPDWSEREPCISYIKHANALDFCNFGTVAKQNLLGQPHKTILDRRKRLATVVVDNLCDGHWGLSGHESIALGLPTLVYNHPKTHEALREYVGVKDGWNDRLDHPSLPFGELTRHSQLRNFGIIHEMDEVVACVEEIHSWPKAKYDCLRRDIRAWTERHFNSEKLISRFWEPFVDELLVAKSSKVVSAVS